MVANVDFQVPHEVEALIAAAGGPSALAKQLGFAKESGRQRVSNWRANGRIPAMVVMAYRPFFKRLMARAMRGP